MKQIFIPTIGYYTIDSQLKRYDKIAISNKEFVDIFLLGLVNQQLGNKANAKEIVSVEEHESFKGYYECEDKRILTFAEKVAEFGYPVKDGYLITYLESDMIASKNDLESAWKFVRNQSFLEETDSISDEYNYLTFNEWFEENFNNQS